MSLKTFHIIFIIASIICSLFFAGWSYKNFIVSSLTVYLITAIASTFVSLSLVIYEIYFIKKIHA